jgi:hypothetical protein
VLFQVPRGNRATIPFMVNMVSVRHRVAKSSFSGSRLYHRLNSSSVHPRRRNSWAMMRSALLSALSRRGAPEWGSPKRISLQVSGAAAIDDQCLVATAEDRPEKRAAMPAPQFRFYGRLRPRS